MNDTERRRKELLEQTRMRYYDKGCLRRFIQGTGLFTRNCMKRIQKLEKAGHLESVPLSVFFVLQFLCWQTIKKQKS